MKKVLFVVSTLQKSGPIEVLLNTVKSLNRYRYDPIILTLSKKPKNSQINAFQKLGVKIEFLNTKRLNVLFLMVLLMQRIEKLSPDVIHSHGFRANFFLALINKRIMHIATIHNNSYLDYTYVYGKLGQLMAVIYMAVIRIIPICSGCSKNVSEICEDKINKQTINIQNGVNTSDFSSVNTKTKQKFRKQLNLPVTTKHYPIHPRARKPIQGFATKIPNNISVIEPLGYLDMMALIHPSDSVFTDSGGLQKEAFFLNKKCVTLRDTTEWVETIALGMNTLGLNATGEVQFNTIQAFLSESKVAHAMTPYGKGNAAEKIVACLL